MTNTMNDRITDDTIRDIDAQLPQRCPDFIATMHAAIDAYFDDPAAPATNDEHRIISNRLICLRFN